MVCEKSVGFDAGFWSFAFSAQSLAGWGGRLYWRHVLTDQSLPCVEEAAALRVSEIFVFAMR